MHGNMHPSQRAHALAERAAKVQSGHGLRKSAGGRTDRSNSVRFTPEKRIRESSRPTYGTSMPHGR